MANGERSDNPVAKAIGKFMFGTEDPGRAGAEAQAMGAETYRMGMARTMASTAPGLAQSWADSAPKAAQAMRDRYFAQEYKQIQQTQISPLIEEMQAATSAAREKLRVADMPVPRTVSYEEAEARKLASASQGPGVEQPVPGGPEGAKSKTVTAPPPGMHAPSPAQQGDGSIMNAMEYSEEVPSVLDPVTGQPVPIASARGIAIQSEVFDELGEIHKSVQLKMMDTLAQYAGNPYVTSAMQSMLEATIGAAGTAVTGKTDPMSQQEWWENRQRFDADMETADLAQQEQMLKLETTAAIQRADAADAINLSSSDPEFVKLLSPKLRKAITGKTVDEMSPKQVRELAALSSMYRDRQKEQLAIRKASGMMAIPPGKVNLPQGWHDELNANDRIYQGMEREYFAQMAADQTREVQAVSNMPASRQEQWFEANSVPQDLRALIRTGNVKDPAVQNWVETKVIGTDAYEESKVKAYFDRMELVVDEQPEVRAQVLAGNDQFIREYIAKYAEEGYPMEQLGRIARELEADVWGTHYLATHDEPAPTLYRPTQAKARLAQFQNVEKEREAKRLVTPAVRQAVAPEVRAGIEGVSEKEAMRSLLSRPAGEKPDPSVEDYLRRMEVEAIPSEQLTAETPPAAMSQAQIKSEIDAIDELFSNLRATGSGDLLTSEQLTALRKRRAFLMDNYYDPMEKAVLKGTEFVSDLFIETEEERKQKRELREKSKEDILRYVPKVN